MWKRLVVACSSLATVAALLAAWLLLPEPQAAAGWSEVRAAMESHRSLTCRQVIREKGKPDDISRCQILGDGRSRFDEADGSYTVIDATKHRQMHVQTKERQATLMEGVRVPPANLYEIIKGLPQDTTAKALPAKKIDGRDVLGFVVKVEEAEQTVWADAATRLPVRIEAVDESDKDGPVELIVDEFKFDEPLDPKLFAFEAPGGYQVKTTGSANFPDAPTEPDLKNLVVTPLVGIGPLKFRVSRDEVEKVLGKPDSVNEPVPGGLAILNYGSRGLFLHVSPKMGLLLVMCTSQKASATRVRDFGGKTDKGITLGATKAEIIKAYGEPESQEEAEGTVMLSYGKLRVNFTLVGDKVVEMMFNRP